MLSDRLSQNGIAVSTTYSHARGPQFEPHTQHAPAREFTEGGHDHGDSTNTDTSVRRQAYHQPTLETNKQTMLSDLFPHFIVNEKVLVHDI